MEEVRCKCGRSIKIESKTIWKHDNTKLLFAVSVLTLQCNGCNAIINYVAPHNTIASKEFTPNPRE